MDWIRAFVKEQLEIRGIDVTEEQMDFLVRWFRHWFDDSHDMLCDALWVAFHDMGIEMEVSYDY